MRNEGLEQYRRELKKALSCPPAARRELLGQAEGLLENFREENPDCSYEDLTAAFGPPEVFAGEMLGTLDREALGRFHAGRRWLLGSAAALAAVVLVICVAFRPGTQGEAVEDTPHPQVTEDRTLQPQVTFVKDPDGDTLGTIYVGVGISKEDLESLFRSKETDPPEESVPVSSWDHGTAE